MARRRKNRAAYLAELVVKVGIGLTILLVLVSGGFVDFQERFLSALGKITLLGGMFAGLAGMIFILASLRKSSAPTGPGNQWPFYERSKTKPIEFIWTTREIYNHLSKIDWYQFEKFCAEILKGEDFTVERKGGASPDGGVDLIAQKNETQTLIQCKHWRSWKLRESVVRELMGSMVDFNVKRAALFFSGEITAPAKALADKHGIGLVDGFKLAERALKVLPKETLDKILKCNHHHCPKCEALMIWRTGNFKPFWGCSNFPRCRGVLKHTGPR